MPGNKGLPGDARGASGFPAHGSCKPSGTMAYMLHAEQYALAHATTGVEIVL
jgi:hypothetical protein